MLCLYTVVKQWLKLCQNQTQIVNWIKRSFGRLNAFFECTFWKMLAEENAFFKHSWNTNNLKEFSTRIKSASKECIKFFKRKPKTYFVVWENLLTIFRQSMVQLSLVFQWIVSETIFWHASPLYLWFFFFFCILPNKNEKNERIFLFVSRSFTFLIILIDFFFRVTLDECAQKEKQKEKNLLIIWWF